MRLFILAVLISVVFLSCGDKLSVSGAWKNGNNELELTPDNNFTLYDSGTKRLSGIYTLVFDKMQFINTGDNLEAQCIKPGRYSFTLLNDSLQLTMQDDPCTRRKFMLNGTYWVRRH